LSEADIGILSILKPDVVLFVGDIAEGNIKIIKIIKSLQIPSYVVLGNHDRGRDQTGETLSKQIRILNEKYCAWDLKIFSNKINILGCRPCSSGGGYFLSKEVKGVYGPLTEDDSVKKIIGASLKAREDLPLLLLSHTGPTGLGSDPDSICGRDWKKPPIDWGDRDLSIAIKDIQKNRKVDLVVFGHMHNILKRNLGLRKMIEIDNKGTAYLNTAVVPRYKTNKDGTLLINFSWVEFKNNKLENIFQRWYSNDGRIKKEDVLYEKTSF